VNATHVGIFSLITYGLYKLFGSKDNKQAARAAPAVEEEADEPVISNYLM